MSPPIDRKCLIQEAILSNCNWFQFCDAIEKQYGFEFASALETVYDSLISFNELDDAQKALHKLTHQAYVYDRDFSCQLYEREASALNGLVVSDSENENAEEFVGLKDLNDIRVKALVSRCQTSVRCHAKYLMHKKIC